MGYFWEFTELHFFTNLFVDLRDFPNFYWRFLLLEIKLHELWSVLAQAICYKIHRVT